MGGAAVFAVPLMQNRIFSLLLMWGSGLTSCWPDRGFTGRLERAGGGAVMPIVAEMLVITGH